MGGGGETVLFFIFFQNKKGAILIFDNKREKEMWSWEKKLFIFYFFNLTKN